MNLKDCHNVEDFRKLAKNVVFNDSSAAFKPSVSLGMHTTWVV